MASDIRKLFELQLVDTELQQIERKRGELRDPATVESAVEQLRERASEVQAQFEKLSAELKDCELHLQGVEEKLKRDKARLTSGKITNPKELENLQREVEALGRQRSSLDEKALTLMEEVEAQRERAKAASAELSQREAELETVRKNHTEALKWLGDQERELREARGRAGAVVPPALLRRYETLLPRTNHLVVARLDGNLCTGCRIAVNAFLVRRARETDDIVTCENCGRILYGDRD